MAMVTMIMQRIYGPYLWTNTSSGQNSKQIKQQSTQGAARIKRSGKDQTLRNWSVDQPGMWDNASVKQQLQGEIHDVDTNNWNSTNPTSSNQKECGRWAELTTY